MKLLFNPPKVVLRTQREELGFLVVLLALFIIQFLMLFVAIPFLKDNFMVSTQQEALGSEV